MATPQLPPSRLPVPGQRGGMPARNIPLSERPVIDMRPKGMKPYDPSVMRKRIPNRSRIPGRGPAAAGPAAARTAGAGFPHQPPPAPAPRRLPAGRFLTGSAAFPEGSKTVLRGGLGAGGAGGAGGGGAAAAAASAADDVTKAGMFSRLIKTGLPLVMLAWMWADILGQPKEEAENLFQQSVERGMGWQNLVDTKGMELRGMRDQLALMDTISQLPSADDGQFARMLQDNMPVMQMAAMAANQMPAPVAPDMSTQLAMQQGVIG